MTASNSQQASKADKTFAKQLDTLLPGLVEVAGEITNVTVTGLSADSRQLEPGFVFAALKGVNVDGTAYIDGAIEKGAVAVLTDMDFNGDISVPVIKSKNPRRTFALMAAHFYEKQPRVIAAVTGTAGKTSVAAFLRQIWTFAGFSSASIGTVGITSDVETCYGSLTTPDPVQLHQDLARLTEKGVSHLVMEASSHGLDQSRLDGVRVSVGGFTNLGRDHMDYHATIEEYFEAKMLLIDRILPDRAPMVIDADSPFGTECTARASSSGCEPLTVGENGDGVHLRALEPSGFSQKMRLAFGEDEYDVVLPLVGRFQVSNALVAAGMAFATGVKADLICQALENLKGEAGRLEYMGSNSKGALIFIDYAHKVEALENVLSALRPYAKGQLIAVFGCGGDRDKGKRPLMGEVSSRLADCTIVTDDNPRTEDPKAIRAQILERVTNGKEIGDRELAIKMALDHGHSGDVIVIAGKGHETGQIIGDDILPFSDHEVVQRLLGEVGGD